MPHEPGHVREEDITGLAPEVLAPTSLTPAGSGQVSSTPGEQVAPPSLPSLPSGPGFFRQLATGIQQALATQTSNPQFFLQQVAAEREQRRKQKANQEIQALSGYVSNLYSTTDQQTISKGLAQVAKLPGLEPEAGKFMADMSLKIAETLRGEVQAKQEEEELKAAISTIKPKGVQAEAFSSIVLAGGDPKIALEYSKLFPEPKDDIEMLTLDTLTGKTYGTGGEIPLGVNSFKELVAKYPRQAMNVLQEYNQAAGQGQGLELLKLFTGEVRNEMLANPEIGAREAIERVSARRLRESREKGIEAAEAGARVRRARIIDRNTLAERFDLSVEQAKSNPDLAIISPESQKVVNETRNAAATVDKLSKYALETIQAKTGGQVLAQRGKALVGQIFATNELSLLRLLNKNAGAMVVRAFGDTGRLSDPDIERGEGVLINEKDTVRIAQLKDRLLRGLIKAAIDAELNGLNVTKVWNQYLGNAEETIRKAGGSPSPKTGLWKRNSVVTSSGKVVRFE